MNFASFSLTLVRHRSRRSAGLIAVEQVDSTHLLGRRIAEEYIREGSPPPESDIVAWRQLAGRGRHGRVWSSPPGGGVYATLIRHRAQRHWLRILPLQAAVALGETMNSYVAGRCRLKWPNDLVVGGKKLGGILIDAITHGGESPVALISFGVNHGSDLAAFGEPGSTSVSREAAEGEAPPLSGFVLELIEALDRELAEEGPASRVLERYQELSSHTVGEELRCRFGAEEEYLEGRFLGFDEHGFLRLEVRGEQRLVSTGEILGSG